MVLQVLAARAAGGPASQQLGGISRGTQPPRLCRPCLPASAWLPSLVKGSCGHSASTPGTAPWCRAPWRPAALRPRCPPATQGALPPAIQGAAPAWGSGRGPSPRLLRGAPPLHPTGTQPLLPAGCPPPLPSPPPAGPHPAWPPLRPPSARAWTHRFSGVPGPPGCRGRHGVRCAQKRAQGLQRRSRAHDPSLELQHKQSQVSAEARSGCC